jgi:hypothetical protein
VPKASAPPTEQLRLPLPGDDELRTATLARIGQGLADLELATAYLQAVARGRVKPGAGAVAQLGEALALLARRGPLPGRLAYLARRCATEPIEPARWNDVVDDLAFALALYHQGATQ